MDAPIAPCDAENNDPLLVLGVKVGKTGPPVLVAGFAAKENTAPLLLLVGTSGVTTGLAPKENDGVGTDETGAKAEDEVGACVLAGVSDVDTAGLAPKTNTGAPAGTATATLAAEDEVTTGTATGVFAGGNCNGRAGFWMEGADTVADCVVLGLGRGTADLAPNVKAGVVVGAVVGAVEIAVARVVEGGLEPKVKAGLAAGAVVGVAAGVVEAAESGLAPNENAGAAEVGVVEAIEGVATEAVSTVVLGPGVVEGAEVDFDPKENEGAAEVDADDDGAFDEGTDDDGEAGVLPNAAGVVEVEEPADKGLGPELLSAFLAAAPKIDNPAEAVAEERLETLEVAEESPGLTALRNRFAC